MTIPDTVTRMSILQNPHARRARAEYIRAFELENINDQAVYDCFEDAALDSIARGDGSATVDTELAEAVLVLLKNAIRRPRGGRRLSRHERLRRGTFISQANARKTALVASGMDATEAHLQAAEEIAEEAKERGIGFTAGYLAREMQHPRHRH